MKKSALLVKCCENCIKGISVGIRNEVLCREKGIVSADFYCSGFMTFEMDSLHRQLDYRCSDCIHFNFVPDSHNSSYGICSMFSVRKCDGSIKKACSKFRKRPARKFRFL